MNFPARWPEHSSLEDANFYSLFSFKEEGVGVAEVSEQLVNGRKTTFCVTWWCVHGSWSLMSVSNVANRKQTDLLS